MVWSSRSTPRPWPAPAAAPSSRWRPQAATLGPSAIRPGVASISTTVTAISPWLPASPSPAGVRPTSAPESARTNENSPIWPSVSPAASAAPSGYPSTRAPTVASARLQHQHADGRRQHPAQVGPQERRVQEHPDRQEERGREQGLEREDLAQRVLGVVALRDQEPSQERADGQAHAGQATRPRPSPGRSRRRRARNSSVRRRLGHPTTAPSGSRAARRPAPPPPPAPPCPSAIGHRRRATRPGRPSTGIRTAITTMAKSCNSSIASATWPTGVPVSARSESTFSTMAVDDKRDQEAREHRRPDPDAERDQPARHRRDGQRHLDAAAQEDRPRQPGHLAERELDADARTAAGSRRPRPGWSTSFQVGHQAQRARPDHDARQQEPGDGHQPDAVAQVGHDDAGREQGRQLAHERERADGEGDTQGTCRTRRGLALRLRTARTGNARRRHDHSANPPPLAVRAQGRSGARGRRRNGSAGRGVGSVPQTLPRCPASPPSASPSWSRWRPAALRAPAARLEPRPRGLRGQRPPPVHRRAGTFDAVVPHLDRLQAMGVGVLWLMPVHPIGQERRIGSLGKPVRRPRLHGRQPGHGDAGGSRGTWSTPLRRAGCG